MPTILHASTVALDGCGVLILGPSGSGKSSLALRLLALGCDLVADDRTAIRAARGGLWADAPEGLPARIEARGVGLMPALLHGPARLVLAVDLGQGETERLPPDRSRVFESCELPVFHNPDNSVFAEAILQYLKTHAHLDT